MKSVSLQITLKAVPIFAALVLLATALRAHSARTGRPRGGLYPTRSEDARPLSDLHVADLTAHAAVGER